MSLCFIIPSSIFKTGFVLICMCLCFDCVKCVGKNGIVHRITERGDIRVQYEGTNNRWTVHPGALTKVNRAFVFFEVNVFHFVS